MAYYETHKRTLLKTISWRITATIITTIVVLALTRQLKLALGAGLIDTTVKFLGYYLHERGWNRINVGKVTKLGEIEK